MTTAAAALLALAAAARAPAAEGLPGMGDANQISVWDASTGKRVRALDGNAGVSDLDFSPDGKRLTAGGKAGRIRPWDVGTGKRLAEPDAR